MEHGGTVVFAKKARAPANQLFVYAACHEGDTAGQMAGVTSFEVREQNHRTLVWSLLEEPLDAMCSRPSLEHLRVTDKLTRTQLATSARKSSGPCVGSRHTPIDALAAVFRDAGVGHEAQAVANVKGTGVKRGHPRYKSSDESMVPWSKKERRKIAARSKVSVQHLRQH